MGKTEHNLNIPTVYQIKIQGRLEEKWAEWFNGTLVEKIKPNANSLDTQLIIMVPDQAALRGVVNKIWDLNLKLISINLLEKELGDHDENELYSLSG